MPKKHKTRSAGYSMESTSLRYLAMLQEVPRFPKSRSAEEIHSALSAAGYEVDLRSIQRDLQKLASNFGLESVQQAKKLLWRYKADARVWMFPGMDEHTALVYQMVDMYMKPLLPAKTLDAMAPWVMRAKTLLSGRAGKAARWSEKVHVMPLGLPRQGPAIGDVVKSNVYSALLQETPLEIEYKNRDGEVNTHIISPLGMIVRENLFYLVAHDQSKPKPIVLAMHRMRRADLMEEQLFNQPKGFNLKSFADEQFAIPMGEEKVIDIKIRISAFSAVNIGECPLAKNQQLVKDGDSFLLTATVPNTHELHRWISSLGPHAEVLAPGFLREKFKDEYKKLSKLYASKPAS